MVDDGMGGLLLPPYRNYGGMYGEDEKEGREAAVIRQARGSTVHQCGKIRPSPKPQGPFWNGCRLIGDQPLVRCSLVLPHHISSPRFP